MDFGHSLIGLKGLIVIIFGQTQSTLIGLSGVQFGL